MTLQDTIRTVIISLDGKLFTTADIAQKIRALGGNHKNITSGNISKHISDLYRKTEEIRLAGKQDSPTCDQPVKVWQEVKCKTPIATGEPRRSTKKHEVSHNIAGLELAYPHLFSDPNWRGNVTRHNGWSA